MTTNTNNLDGFAAIKLRPRILVDVSRRDLCTSVLGHEISVPIMVAPSGFQQRYHPDGDLATARAAGAVGTVMTLSTCSTYDIEEVAEVATGPIWFQLYVFKDRQLTELLVRRAERAGYSALVVTVDLPGKSSREREMRYSFSLTEEFKRSPNLQAERILRNFAGIDLPKLPTEENFTECLESALTWSDLEWLRAITPMPLVIKGIQTAEDARLCVEHGVEGLVVSNHGGHAVPGARATIEALPEISEVVGDAAEIYLDGGIRQGTDVLKSLALGARATFIGRAYMWGLTVAGEKGIVDVFNILREELDIAMCYCGLTDVKGVDRLVADVPGPRPIPSMAS